MEKQKNQHSSERRVGVGVKNTPQDYPLLILFEISAGRQKVCQALKILLLVPATKEF